jgi:hypothetical protein
MTDKKDPVVTGTKNREVSWQLRIKSAKSAHEVYTAGVTQQQQLMKALLPFAQQYNIDMVKLSDQCRKTLEGVVEEAKKGGQ